MAATKEAKKKKAKKAAEPEAKAEAPKTHPMVEALNPEDRPIFLPAAASLWSTVANKPREECLAELEASGVFPPAQRTNGYDPNLNRPIASRAALRDWFADQ